jgi:Tfp pilus assembly protein PilF
MTRVVGAVLLACLGLLGTPGTALARWTRLSSAHFVFVGDASERDLREMALRLEQFREALGRVFSDQATTSPVPTVVVVFRNDRSFTPFKPVFQGKPLAVAGYFTPGEDVNYMAVNAERDASAYSATFHEYTHFLIRNAVGDAPVWINEGLAECYQTFEASNGGKSAVIGVPDPDNLRMLRATPTLLPIAQLIAVDRDSAMYNEGERRGLFYAESWALVHYLTFGSPQRAGQLAAYLAAIAGDVAGPEAFRLAFGADTAALDRELQRYVRSPGLTALRLTLDAPIPGGDVAPGEAVTDDEAAGYLGDMMARVNRVDDARAYLRKVIDGNDAAARAMTSLGLLEVRAARMDVAYPLLERAASLAPGVATVQGAWGRILTLRADRGGADEDELYARARAALTRALELEPQNISTAVTLAEVEMGSGENPARAVALMQRAVTAAPGREEYRLMHAQALALNGDYRAASAMLDALVARGSRPEIRDAARRALARVADAEHARR